MKHQQLSIHTRKTMANTKYENFFFRPQIIMDSYICMRSGNNKRIISIKFETSGKLFWIRECIIYLRMCKLKSRIVKVIPPTHTKRFIYRLESRN